MRDWCGEHCLDEVDVANCEHGQFHWVGRSHEIRKERDASGGAGVGAVRLGTGDHPEEGFFMLGFRDGEEGDKEQSAGGELVRLPCNGRAGVIEGGECREKNFPPRCLEFWVWGVVHCSI